MPAFHVQELVGTSHVQLVHGSGYFPVAAVTREGDVLVLYRDGGGHGGHGGFLALKRSSDAGATWSEQITVVNTREYDDRNPALGVAADGTVVVSYHANGTYGAGGASLREDRRSPAKRFAGLVLSGDGGRSWGEPMLWTDATPWGQFSPYGKMLTLPDGTMAMATYWDASYLIRSRDHGRTWGEMRLVADDINETAFAVSPDGDWLCLGRKRVEPQRVQMSVRRSVDNGATWGEPTDFLSGWRYPGDLTVLSDGSILACYGVREPPHGARAKRSTDGGRTWSRDELILYRNAWTGDCGYPSTVRTDGWLVTALYSAGNFRNFTDPTDASCEVFRYREDELIAAFETRRANEERAADAGHGT